MPFMDDLDLAGHGLKYLEADPTTVYLGYDGSPPWLFFNDSERTIESIARYRPSQAKAYRRYLADARPVAELTLGDGHRCRLHAADAGPCAGPPGGEAGPGCCSGAGPARWTCWDPTSTTRP